jgi:Chlorophyll A-B binding protein
LLTATKVQGGLLGMVPFDPAGLNSDKMAVREIKNGRLAMVAFIGFCSQAAVQARSCCCSASCTDCLQTRHSVPVLRTVGIL